MKKMLILLVLIGCSVVGFGQDSVFTIEGRLYDEEMSKPFRKNKIYLIQNENKIDSTFSNWRGFYRFKKLKAGCYSVVTTPYQMLVENDKICFENGGRGEIYYGYNILKPLYVYSEVPIDSSKIFTLKIQNKREEELTDFQYKFVSNGRTTTFIFEKIDSNNRKLRKFFSYENLIEAVENLEDIQKEFPKDRYEIFLNQNIPFAIAPIELTLYQYTYYQISIEKEGYQPFEKMIKIKANQSNFEFVITLEEK